MASEPDPSPHGDPLESARGILAGEAVHSPDPHVRRYALFLAGREKNPAFKGIFLSALRDPDKGVRAQAAAALGGLGEEVVPDVVPLLSDPDWRVRYRAAEILGMAKGRGAVAALVAALADGKDHVRYMAAKALGEIGDQSAVRPLAGRLRDENPYVRKAAVIALGRLGSEEGLGEIRRLEGEERVDFVREAARDVLSRR
ncbi:MAG: HEAT repeat domain-containing protein [Methanolinea sp.]|nr:HEAT repeat domain-containing protein [Methanolinea sp.]